MNPLEWYLIGAVIVGATGYFAGYQGGRSAAEREQRRQRNRLARQDGRQTVTTRGLVDLPKGLGYTPREAHAVDTQFWRPEDGGQPTAEQRMNARAANAKFVRGDISLPKDGGAS